jgi:hypothetical protein
MGQNNSRSINYNKRHRSSTKVKSLKIYGNFEKPEKNVTYTAAQYLIDGCECHEKNSGAALKEADINKFSYV